MLPLPPSQPCGCRVAVGRRVHMASGSPASKKRRPLEPRGRIRDSLHEPVDTAACTGLLVPHIIGEEMGPRAVATACGQVLRPDGSLPVQRARARRLDSSLFLQLLVVVRLLRSLSLLPFVGSPPWFTRSVEAVGAEEYGLFLDGLPQLSARPLSDSYACWQERCVLPSWLDTTLRWGHPIQFKRRPPPFMGLVETTLRDPAASTALAAEVTRLLVKGVITVVPPHESHLGFYSPYFLVSKKPGEKRPILDLRVFNRFVAARKFRMLTGGRSL